MSRHVPERGFGLRWNMHLQRCEWHRVPGEEGVWQCEEGCTAMSDPEEPAVARAQSNVYRAYYEHGLHCEKPEHVRVDDPEACDGCGDELGKFDDVMIALIAAVRTSERERTMALVAEDVLHDLCTRKASQATCIEAGIHERYRCGNCRSQQR